MNCEHTDWIQLLVARHYENTFGSSVVSVGYAPQWDIKFANGETMEVKVDATSIRTHNVCIEYWDSRRNKPTGILETTAKCWIHCIPENEGLRCYEMDTKRLMRLCFEKGAVKIGGDNNSSVMKIIPMQDVIELSLRDFFLSGEKLRFAAYWNSASRKIKINQLTDSILE